MEHTAEKDAAPGEALGWGSGEVAEAVDFAREIAEDWRTRVVVRLDGRRTVNVDNPRLHGHLLWTVYARPHTSVTSPAEGRS